MKKVSIDLSNVFSKYHNEWDGESHNGSFKRFMTSNKKDVVSIVESRLNSLEHINKPCKIEVVMNERMAVVGYSYDDNSAYSLNEWNRQTAEDIKNVLQYFWSKGINAYQHN